MSDSEYNIFSTEHKKYAVLSKHKYDYVNSLCILTNLLLSAEFAWETPNMIYLSSAQWILEPLNYFSMCDISRRDAATLNSHPCPVFYETKTNATL